MCFDSERKDRYSVCVLLGQWHSEQVVGLKISVKLVRQMILSGMLTRKVVDQQ